MEKFADSSLMEYSGDVRKDYSYEELVKFVERLCFDKKSREHCSSNMQQIVNGCGAYSIAEQLLA